jgi:hypothetical protein
LGSLKHVINIIMWIRDTGCYNGLAHYGDAWKAHGLPQLDQPSLVRWLWLWDIKATAQGVTLAHLLISLRAP